LPGICKAIGKALNKEPNIVLYSPEEVGTGKSGKAEGFPFRTVHFFASAEKAKRELGWKPQHDFLADAPALVRDYVASGRQNKDIDFSIDDKILAAVKPPGGGGGSNHSVPSGANRFAALHS
jgi:hypothetical protein